MLEWLQLTSFRSYSDYQLVLSPEVTLVVGPNASGKTNLLEGLFVLSTTKSFRAKDIDLVNYGHRHFRLAAGLDGRELALGYEHGGGTSRKKASHDGKQKTLSSHIGTLPVSLFEPGDLDMATGAPELRRRYLDYILSQTDRQYLQALTLYKKVLRQRNKLLSDFAITDIKDQIFVWDVKLAEAAAVILEARLKLLRRLDQVLVGLYAGIASQTVAIKLSYLPSVGGDYADQFLAALGRNLPRDLAAGFTTIGPHREDFAIKFKDQNLDRVASRGEIRSLVLALKLAELAYLAEVLGREPILLLDDVFSELDPGRRHALTLQLKGRQTLITATDFDQIPKGLAMKVVRLGGSDAGRR